MKKIVIGIDYDGVLRDSFGHLLDSLNYMLTEYKLPLITENELKEKYQSNWKKFIISIGATEDTWKPMLDFAIHKFHTYDHEKIVPNMELFLKQLSKKANIFIITNNKNTEIINDFLIKNKVEQYVQDVVFMLESKEMAIRRINADFYIGDAISDAESCVELDNVHFLGIMHEYAFNHFDTVKDFTLKHPNKKMTLVTSFNEIINIINKE